MVNLKIELGNCTCPFSFPHPFAKTCRRDNAIVLGPKCTEHYILPALNHETIHAVLNNLFLTNQTSRQFDNLFPSDEDSVSEDGTPIPQNNKP
jgi:hypothetical protein